MNSIPAAIVTGAITFAATNIDDIFVLMLFFSQTNQNFRAGHIIVGQYLGFTALVLISLVGFLGGLIIPPEWIGLLGLLPIIIGVRHWLKRNKSETDEAEANVSKANSWAAISSVAAVTFANGGDNIGIYTPLFASSDSFSLVITLLVFYLLLGVWCYAGYVIIRHPLVARVLSGYAHYIVPFVLIGLGIYILLESRTLRLFGL